MWLAAAPAGHCCGAFLSGASIRMGCKAGQRRAPLWSAAPRDILTDCPAARFRRIRFVMLKDQPVRSMAKAMRNPIVVMNPVRMWVSSNASGSIVSAIIARMAPAATAVMTAMRTGEAPSKVR